MTTAETIQIITAATALAAVILSPWQASRIARRQVKAEVVSANRQDWINTLRNNLAELVTSLQVSGSPHHAKRYSEAEHKEAFRLILLREAKIRLMMNPNEADHQALIAAIADARVAASDDPPEDYEDEVHGRVMERVEKIVQQSQAIMKREWERVKAGS